MLNLTFTSIFDQKKLKYFILIVIKALIYLIAIAKKKSYRYHRTSKTVKERHSRNSDNYRESNKKQRPDQTLSKEN